jgi:hypothetical protein
MIEACELPSRPRDFFNTPCILPLTGPVRISAIEVEELQKNEFEIPLPNAPSIHDGGLRRNWFAFFGG